MKPEAKPTTGPAAKPKFVSDREWLKQEQTPAISEVELREKLRREFKRNNIIDEGKWENIFNGMFDTWFKHTFRPIVAPEVRQQNRAASAVKTEQMVARGMEQYERKVEERAQIRLLDWAMPNGKKFGDCNGTEIRRMYKTIPAWLRVAAETVKPRQLARNARTEEQWEEVYNTHGGLNNPRKLRK